MSNIIKYAITILFTVIVNNECAESYPKGSLAFVIDSTESMYTVIGTVKSSAADIFQTVNKAKDTPIDNFVLVTFGDPDVFNETITRNVTEFENTLGAIELKSGGDCPEMCLSGIKKALEKSLPGSFLYVFTDASAKDNKTLKKVIEIAQKKDTQVVFILTGECEHSNTTVKKMMKDVYQELADATKGVVFNMLDSQISKILEHVKYSIESRKTSLYHSTMYKPGNHTFNFTTDDRTSDTAITLTGSQLTVTVIGPDNDPVLGDNLVQINKLLVKKFDESKPGVHKVSFSSENNSYVIVSATTDVHFRHGFSKGPPSSFNDTVYKPFPGVNNYITIKLYGENVSLSSVELLKLNYNTLMEIPLHILDEKQQLYVTEAFIPPKPPFRVSIRGTDKNHESTIMRFGMMLLEEPENKEISPTVNIKGDRKVTVNYDKALELNCTVTANPKPTVVWKNKDDGTLLLATEKSLSSVLKIERAKKDATYECYAQNSLGNDTKSVQVEIVNKPYFNVLEQPKDVTVDINEEVVLHCKVDAYPPAKIIWSYRKPYRSKHFPKSAIEISPDGSTLTIKQMQKSTSGTYVCVAHNINKRIAPRATVSISAVIVENKTSDVNVKEGGSTTLSCSVAESKPVPEIRWFRKFATPRFAIYEEMEDEINKKSVVLKNLNRYDTGIYKCIAQNVMSPAYHAIHVSVEYKPEIKNNVTSIVVKMGDVIKNMSCNVQGLPEPTVKWLKDGNPLSSEILDDSDHRFRIDKVDLDDTGNYTCIATNTLGSTYRTVEVIVHTLYILVPHPNGTQTFKRNTKHTLQCPIRGVPTPSIKWYFTANFTHPLVTLPDAGFFLIVAKFDETRQGDYTCEATNIGGTLMYTHSVSLEWLEVKIDKEFRAVDGDRLLRVHCNVTGSPKPISISWGKNGAPLSIAGDYSTDEGWLIIKNINKFVTHGSYYCEGKNTGRLSENFKIIVEDCPSDESIRNITTVWVHKGEKADIKCYVEHKIGDDSVRWYRNKNLLPQREIVLNKAELDDSGVYTCRVNYGDLSEAKSANTKVIVGFGPKFVNKEDVIRELTLAETTLLSCAVEGQPKPRVIWWYEDKLIKTPSEMVYKIKMNAETAGKYTCEVTNHFGSVNRTFHLVLIGRCALNIDGNSKEDPLILSTTHELPTFKILDGLLVIPHNHYLVFSCPKYFKNFKRAELTAQCEEGTTFKINGTLHYYEDLKCNDEFLSRNIITKEKCGIKGTGKEISVAFDYRKPVEVFKVCVDKDNVPKYASHIMRSAAELSPKDTTMLDVSIKKNYNCKSQKASINKILKKIKTKPYLTDKDCCFGKRYLVNPKDIFLGPSQRAAFNNLNMVPQWSSCNAENWEDLEKRVRNLAKSVNDDLIVYTGPHEQVSVDGDPSKRGKGKIRSRILYLDKPIPRYLWKVVQHPASRSSLAIIQLNTPKLTMADVDRHILCRDICNDVPWMSGHDWYKIEKGLTYCCNLYDFVMAFKYNDVFKHDLDNVLNLTII